MLVTTVVGTYTSESLLVFSIEEFIIKLQVFDIFSKLIFCMSSTDTEDVEGEGALISGEGIGLSVGMVPNIVSNLLFRYFTRLV